MPFDYSTIDLDAITSSPAKMSEKEAANLKAMRDWLLARFEKGKVQYILVHGRRYKVTPVK